MRDTESEESDVDIWFTLMLISIIFLKSSDHFNPLLSSSLETSNGFVLSIKHPLVRLLPNAIQTQTHNCTKSKIQAH